MKARPADSIRACPNLNDVYARENCGECAADAYKKLVMENCLQTNICKSRNEKEVELCQLVERHTAICILYLRQTTDPDIT